ncbi:MAG: VanW family protein, partial [Eubacteriales bacterium]
VERGFRMANVYVGNTVQPGIGGGICQVSSTMFNAVVYADLDITSRRNHTLPVTYVPMGRDATVSYGSVDFKFKNNYSKPIEIRAECIGRKNVITIYGTNERPNRKIEIETEKTGTTSPKVVRKEDSSMPEGKVKVESAGTNGSSYIAYKVVYENGVKISSDVLCKSTYSGKDRVEIVGTKKASPSPSASSTTTAKPSGDPKQTAPAPSAPPDAEPNSETAQRP